MGAKSKQFALFWQKISLKHTFYKLEFEMFEISLEAEMKQK
jgi:hypothetical protein